MKDLIMDELEEKMEEGISSLERSLKKVRTGRASIALLDGIKVDYYGSLTPLNQVATLSTPESRLVLISPWDKNAIGEIEKAIQKSDLGLVPNNDGNVIRIAIPPLTEESRKELVKVVKKMAEESRVRLRNVRRDANNQFKTLKKDNEISEDDLYGYQTDVQKVTDEYIKKVDDILAAKEKEIMEI
ncbi:MAG: ribosome recycling factor [Thermodesulfobacteriota bacterium]|nr:ribosome recycling factor [Thermodesulfobacteriota bacterium]